MRVDTVIQRETILQFENPRFNGAFFYRYDRFINSIITNQSDADIDADGSNSSDAKDKTHQNTNAAGIDPDEINGYVLPTSDFKVEKDGRSRKSKESTEIGKANRKAFSSNGVRHKDVALMYNLDNEKSAFGIYVEGGPNNKSGEITPAAARQLDIPADPIHGGMPKNMLLILIFPGSSKDFGGKTPTQRMINQIGDKYFQQNKEIINKAINDTKKTPIKNQYD